MGWLSDKGKRQIRAAENLSNEQAETARFSRKIARSQWNDWEEYGREHLRELSDRVSNWGTEGHISQREGAAVADVKSHFGMAKKRFDMNMARYGIRPGDGKYAGTNRTFEVQRAGAEARAKTDARNTVINEDLQLRGQLVDRWRNNVNVAANASHSAGSQYGNAASRYGQLGQYNRGWGLDKLKSSVDSFHALIGRHIN